MATFHIGQQTDLAVLPQRQALESVSADNPRAGTKRGTDTAPAVPGMEHGRGEIRDPSPGIANVTRESGVRGRETALHVFVLAKDGTPLDPCHPARARKLLEKGRAVVVRHSPFVIRLRDRSAADSEVQGVEVGIDPGSKHSGVSVFTESGGARSGKYAIQLDHRGGLTRDRLTARAAFRRGRRSRNLRYRAPRFSNRARPNGWLAPSLAHRVDTTMSIVRRISRWAPVRAIHVEWVSFDTHAMSAGRSLVGAEYQQGTLAGFEVRQYLLEKWGRSCAYCGVGDTPLQVEHIHPKARGGSNRITNLTLACKPCNQAKGAAPVEVFLVEAPAKLARILLQAKAPLRDAAAANATAGALWRTLEATAVAVYAGSGGRTKWNRSRTGSPKSHTLDALHVGRLDTVAAVPKQVLVITSTGRGSYARTRTDRYGFARLRLPRVKIHYGYATGDLVRAAVPKGKHQGTHTGRVAVRSSGSHTVQTTMGPIKTSWKNLRLLQRGDGYTYHRQEEACGV